MNVPDETFHRFTSAIDMAELPARFTWPFCYVPHPLCLKAAEEVKRHIASSPRLSSEAAEGKMFGVLVVRRQSDGATGYTAAFSGLLGESNNISYFVPPIFDLLSPDGFFKKGEAEITAINRQIDAILASDGYVTLRQQLAEMQADMAQQVQKAKNDMQLAKAERDRQRLAGLSPEGQERLLNQSRFMKAELRRLRKRLNDEISTHQMRLKEYDDHIARLKHQRKVQSSMLQQILFDNYTVSNARGERMNLNQVFKASGIDVPPSGAGECAAPKLLNHAYSNGLQPLAMAEFWMGKPPKSEVRHEGMFYPSCKGKCGPILAFMLQGLDVEHDPMAMEAAKEHHPSIIYDDEVMTIIDKPAGMLSVPGRLAAFSAVDWVERELKLPQRPYAVHRLDMATSGLLVIAKDKATLDRLQRQFETRSVVKRYCADLDGIIDGESGDIVLPLSPDINDRPRQKVDFDNGKTAITHYDVIAMHDGCTRVIFTPLTGRTHQLRVHAASAYGLSCPITGDMLYGKAADRLHLHAAHLELDHPLTGQRLTFDSQVPF